MLAILEEIWNMLEHATKVLGEVEHFHMRFFGSEGQRCNSYL